MNATKAWLVGLFAPAWVLAGPAAGAAIPAYLGDWTITRAVLAPWADPAHPLDPAEPARLTGKTVTFTVRAIRGPPPLACRTPHYKLVEFGADMLFEGAFGEMRSKDRRVEPARIAASLGFPGPRTRTLETGCEIDFHFAGPTTAEFGLNDHVYTIRRR